ncbi:hypothetical protein FIU97_06325 [Roseivivax sp. THAF40]|uniref:DUF4345 family protein n=1 Tax=unclassified Roseivivax TaxID=2639302 RepID=UPI00126883CB|nr:MULTISPECIES: DUF4345 family protein [unclassified Roseivivax]QFS82419.1 hypothetical protein FIV09_06225 [Roseivivax sp. THAF197b]QFT46188.1 hypothetical protein FIU97_06325 [Roseivivax sp. THAF40]
MVDLINIAMALATIAFGAFGLVAPSYTARVLDLEFGASDMGKSELRASAGGLFVALGIGAIVIGAPLAYAMVGLAYLGAAIGRLTANIIDDLPQPKGWTFFAFEAVFAAWLIGANLL